MSLELQIIESLARTYLEAGGKPAGLLAFLNESIEGEVRVRRSQTPTATVYTVYSGSDSIKIKINKEQNENDDTEETYS